MKHQKPILLAIFAIATTAIFWLGQQKHGPETFSPPVGEPSVDAPPNEEGHPQVPQAPLADLTLPLASPSASPVPVAFFEAIAVQFESDQDPRQPSSTDEHSHIVKEWKGRFSPSIQSIASSMGKMDGERLVTLALPSGENLEIVIAKHIQHDSHRGVLTGRIPDSKYSEVIFSYVNQAISGSIMRPQTGEVLDIRNAGEGQQFLAQVDAHKLGTCGVCSPQDKAN